MSQGFGRLGSDGNAGAATARGRVADHLGWLADSVRRRSQAMAAATRGRAPCDSKRASSKRAMVYTRRFCHIIVGPVTLATRPLPGYDMRAPVCHVYTSQLTRTRGRTNRGYYL